MLVWPIPSAEDTVLTYARRVRLTLRDGTTVRPSLKTAQSAVQARDMGLPFPLAVEVGGYLPAFLPVPGLPAFPHAADCEDAACCGPLD
jgi:hypothetical protein